MENNKNKYDLLIKNSIIAFPSVFKMSVVPGYENSEPAYRIYFLFDKKTQIDTINQIKSIFEQIGLEHGFKPSSKNTQCFRDGDELAEEDPKHSVYKGYYRLFAKSGKSPDGSVIRPHVCKIKEGKAIPVMENDELIYGGAICSGYVNFYFYGKGKPNKGIACSLHTVVFNKHGTRLGIGAIDASSQFLDMGDSEEVTIPTNQENTAENEVDLF